MFKGDWQEEEEEEEEEGGLGFKRTHVESRAWTRIFHHTC